MNESASYIWLAFVFGIGAAMALGDRALKTRWLARFAVIGGTAFAGYIFYATYPRGPQFFGLVLFLAMLITAGYVLTEVLFWIGRRGNK